MTRWLVFACLVACNSNGNGLHDVKNGGDADQDKERGDAGIDIERKAAGQGIDPHAAVPGIWHCVTISSETRKEFPCSKTLAVCENHRTVALGNGYNAGTCEQYSFAICFYAEKDDWTGWDCRRTHADCDQRRRELKTSGYEVSRCLRIPKESSRLRPGHRRWRTAARRVSRP